MKWLATVHVPDDPSAPVKHLGLEGTREGFVAVDDSGESINAAIGFTEEDVRDIIEAEFGYYDTFQWLDG